MSPAILRFAVAALALSGALLVRPTPAAADDWHAGLNIRTDFGAHPLRLDAGTRRGAWDFVLVVDPMFWTDGQVDTDLLVQYRFGEHGWALIGGWRTTAIGLADGSQFQQNLVLGFAGDLPEFWSVLRGQAGIELATMVVKHGGGLPSSTIGFGSGREFIDLVHFSLFLRLEYARAF